MILKVKKTKLHIACEEDFIDMIEALLAYGEDVNARDEDGNTPLHIACEQENIKIMDLKTCISLI